MTKHIEECSIAATEFMQKIREDPNEFVTVGFYRDPRVLMPSWERMGAELHITLPLFMSFLSNIALASILEEYFADIRYEGGLAPESRLFPYLYQELIDQVDLEQDLPTVVPGVGPWLMGRISKTASEYNQEWKREASPAVPKAYAHRLDMSHRAFLEMYQKYSGKVISGDTDEEARLLAIAQYIDISKDIGGMMDLGDGYTAGVEYIPIIKGDACCYEICMVLYHLGNECGVIMDAIVTNMGLVVDTMYERILFKCPMYRMDDGKGNISLRWRFGEYTKGAHERGASETEGDLEVDEEAYSEQEL